MRWLHGAIVGVFVLLVAVCLLSPWLSPYSIVVNAGSLVNWFLVLLAPRLYWLIRVPLPVWVRSRPLVLDVPAAAILLLGVFVECSGPMPPVHLFGVPLSIPSAAALALLAVVVLAIRHWALPEHPALARIFRGFGDPEATGEARLFGPPGEPAWRKAAEIGIVGVGFSALVAIVTWPQVARLDSVPDLGDPLFSIWRIAWIAHQIVRDPVHLFDGNMFYPEHLTLALSDPVIVPGLMSAPFFWLGGHPRHDLQPAVPVRLRLLRRHDLSARARADRAPRRGRHRGHRLRALPLSFRALQPSRAADDDVGAAGAVGAASHARERRAARRRSRRVSRWRCRRCRRSTTGCSCSCS